MQTEELLAQVAEQAAVLNQESRGLTADSDKAEMLSVTTRALELTTGLLQVLRDYLNKPSPDMLELAAARLARAQALGKLARQRELMYPILRTLDRWLEKKDKKPELELTNAELKALHGQVSNLRAWLNMNPTAPEPEASRGTDV